MKLMHAGLTGHVVEAMPSQDLCVITLGAKQAYFTCRERISYLVTRKAMSSALQKLHLLLLLPDTHYGHVLVST